VFRQSIPVVPKVTLGDCHVYSALTVNFVSAIEAYHLREATEGSIYKAKLALIIAALALAGITFLATIYFYIEFKIHQ